MGLGLDADLEIDQRDLGLVAIIRARDALCATGRARPRDNWLDRDVRVDARDIAGMTNTGSRGISALCDQQGSRRTIRASSRFSKPRPTLSWPTAMPTPRST